MKRPVHIVLRKLIVVSVMVLCAWVMAGQVICNIARHACYQYVHNIKSERSFRDTLTIPTQVLHSDEVVWFKKNEIRYQNRMFDIKRSTQKGSETILIGHYDDAEHKLYKLLAKLFNTGKDNPINATTSAWLSVHAVLLQHTTPVIYEYISLPQHFLWWKNRFNYYIHLSPAHDPPDGLL